MFYSVSYLRLYFCDGEVHIFCLRYYFNLGGIFVVVGFYCVYYFHMRLYISRGFETRCIFTGYRDSICFRAFLPAGRSLPLASMKRTWEGVNTWKSTECLVGPGRSNGICLRMNRIFPSLCRFRSFW